MPFEHIIKDLKISYEYLEVYSMIIKNTNLEISNKLKGVLKNIKLLYCKDSLSLLDIVKIQLELQECIKDVIEKDYSYKKLYKVNSILSDIIVDF